MNIFLTVLNSSLLLRWQPHYFLSTPQEDNIQTVKATPNMHLWTPLSNIAQFLSFRTWTTPPVEQVCWSATLSPLLNESSGYKRLFGVIVANLITAP